jgi:hypothetical protein
MSDGHGLSSLQLTLITGTLLIANLAAFWFIRKNFFKESEDEKKEREADSDFFNSILSETEWKEFELIEKKIITHNTSIYRFKLPTEDSVLPLPIGQVIKRKRNKLIIIII